MFNFKDSRAWTLRKRSLGLDFCAITSKLFKSTAYEEFQHPNTSFIIKKNQYNVPQNSVFHRIPVFCVSSLALHLNLKPIMMKSKISTYQNSAVQLILMNAALLLLRNLYLFIFFCFVWFVNYVLIRCIQVTLLVNVRFRGISFVCVCESIDFI